MYPQSKSNYFKYSLNLLQDLDFNADIEDITGKKMKAIIIFSMLIKYFKKSLLDAINLSIAEGRISKSDVDFVLAVPARCGDGAKFFMREAARKVIWIFGL